MAEAKTIDQLINSEASLRYAQDDIQSQKTRKYVTHATEVASLANTTADSISFSPETEALLGTTSQTIPISSFSPPEGFTTATLFSEQLIPSLGDAEAQKTFLSRLENEKTEKNSAEEKEKEILQKFFLETARMQKDFADIKSRMKEYTKG